MFLNLTILLYDRFHLIYRVCLVVGIAALVQAMNALTKIDFLAEWSVVARAIAQHMKGNTGNINIFSASLLYKIPFILIGMWHYGEGWRRGILSLSLFVTTSDVLLINARASLLA